MGIVSGVYRNWIWEFGDLKSDNPIFYGIVFGQLRHAQILYDGVEDNRIR